MQKQHHPILTYIKQANWEKCQNELHVNTRSINVFTICQSEALEVLKLWSGDSKYKKQKKKNTVLHVK